MTRIALRLQLTGSQIERLRREIGEAELVESGNLDGCDVAFGNPHPEEIVQTATLRWVQLESVGFGEYLELDWRVLGKRLTLTNLAGLFADPVAETALAGLLALNRGVDQLILLQSRLEWQGDPVRSRLRLLKGARVVMLGFGAINRRLAELLSPFECRIGTLTSASTEVDLDRMLPETDILIAALPETSRTKGLLSAERLARLPGHAVIANLGRGSLLDETALAEALTAGRLAGAVLDVTLNEPLPPGHPFWTCPNVILTQHSGGGTADEMDIKIDVFLDNLSRYRRGDALTRVVDILRGY